MRSVVRRTVSLMGQSGNKQIINNITSQSPIDYSQWTREALIERIRTLEQQPSVTGPFAKRHKRADRLFNHENYPTMHVALKVAYFGWNYNGFASQRSYDASKSQDESQSNVVTVEDEIFDALLRTKLIKSPKECKYSRCGRTDTGVSSTAQVIALTLRCSGKRTEEYSAAGTMDLSLCTMLNRNLPSDIRVLGWCKVNADFNARFSCRGRRYLYYFCPVGLDIGAMQSAAAKLVGEHDFRHFARRDPNRPNQSTIRRIFKSEIRVEECSERGMAVYEIHGSAFLYHQVRCTMQLLLLIGRGLEPVTLIDRLLQQTSDIKGPLQYELASEVPLVLAECYYDEGLVFGCDEGEVGRLEGDLFKISNNLAARSRIASLLQPEQWKDTTPFLRLPSAPHPVTKQLDRQ